MRFILKSIQKALWELQFQSNAIYCIGSIIQNTFVFTFNLFFVYHGGTLCTMRLSTNYLNLRCLHITYSLKLVFPHSQLALQLVKHSSLCTLLILHRWASELGQFLLCGGQFTISTESTTDRSSSPPPFFLQRQTQNTGIHPTLSIYPLLPSAPFIGAMLSRGTEI